jgi:hypothetical protein
VGSLDGESTGSLPGTLVRIQPRQLVTRKENMSKRNADLGFLSIKLPETYVDAQLEVLHTDDATVVRATAIVGNTEFQATASSRRDKQDNPNAEIGVKLAVGRAIRQLGRDILHDANALVHMQDEARASREAAKARIKEERERRAKEAKQANALAGVKSMLSGATSFSVSAMDNTVTTTTATKRVAKKTASK